MNKKKLIISIGILISVFSLVNTFIYYKSNRLTIYTLNDTYAYKYAKKNLINTYNLSDSHYKYFNRVWEDFKVNEDNNKITITKYEGLSEELIIPTTYLGKRVVNISADAIPSTVKTIFLPDSIENINEDDYLNKEILCYRGEFCENLKNNDKLNVKVLSDTDSYILNEEKLEFTYNIINNNEIELTNYLGESESIIIPKSINGYKVTKISFDGTGITSIFISESVNDIGGNITSKLFNKCLIISTIMITYSLVIYCILIILTKTYALVDKVYIYSVSIIYLIVINYILYLLRINPFESLIYFIYTLIISSIYVIAIYILKNIVKGNNEYDKSIKDVTSFINETLLLLQDYEYKELDEIKEMLKYSDPVSSSEVKKIEEDIKEEIKSITKDNILEKCKTLKKYINKRNTLIKNNK